MKQTETRTETVQREYVIAEFCDWCGVRIPLPKGIDVRELEISFSAGYSTRDGGMRQGWQVEDLCDDCVAKLRTMLENAGINVKPTEVDW